MSYFCAECGASGRGGIDEFNAHRCAQRARDEGLAQVTAASDDQDINVVDQTILSIGQRGKPFSADDVRPLLPVLRSNNLIGARFNSLRLRKILTLVGEVRSTHEATHGKKIGLYVLTAAADVAA